MKLRVALVTSISRGTASRVLPALLESDKLIVAGAVLIATPARRRFAIKPAKLRKIGLLGALNGLRLRKWYADPDAPDLRTLCMEAGIRCIESDSTNGAQTMEALKGFDADLGLSLGNSYIHQRIFTLPRFGMINLHGELLPDFQGAQSVIWPIYENKRTSGLTIHQVSNSIDGGDILYRKEIPIEFQSSLRATVEATTHSTRAAVPQAVRFVCENYMQLRKASIKQTGGKRYTTPSLRQFLRMLSNHRRMLRNTEV